MNEFEKESVDMLINKFWHSLVDKYDDGKYKCDYLETEFIYKHIETLERLYQIKELLKDWYK